MRFLKHQKYRLYTIYTKLTPNDAETKLTPNDAESCAERKQSHN